MVIKNMALKRNFTSKNYKTCFDIIENMLPSTPEKLKKTLIDKQKECEKFSLIDNNPIPEGYKLDCKNFNLFDSSKEFLKCSYCYFTYEFIEKYENSNCFFCNFGKIEKN
jgi:hypothetical protein